MHKTEKFPEGTDLDHRGGPGAAEMTPTQPELTSLVAPGSGAETPTLSAGGKQQVKAGQRNVISQVKVTGGERVAIPQIGAYESVNAHGKTGKAPECVTRAGGETDPKRSTKNGRRR